MMLAGTGGMIVAVALMIFSIFMLVKIGTTKHKKTMGMGKTVPAIGMVCILAIGLYLGGFLGYLIPAAQTPFLAAVPPGPTPTGEGVTDATEAVCGNGVCEVGETATTCAADCARFQPTTVREQPINTFKVKLQEKYSNKWDQVGNDSTGWFEVYPSDQDPSLPTSEYVERVNISSGEGSASSPGYRTDVYYRVVFNGGGRYYDKDYGVTTFPYADYQKQTGEFLFQQNDVMKVATIDDLVNESADEDSWINGNTNFWDMKLSADSPNCTDEVCGNESADLIYYNETAGDGSWYIQFEIPISGAYTGLQEPVYCFEWDSSNPPEGDEVSEILLEHISGTDFMAAHSGSDISEYWSKEACIPMGTIAKGGTTGKYKITVTYDESALDANDVWYMYVDDLGDIRGKDTVLNTGAAYQRIQFDSFT